MATKAFDLAKKNKADEFYTQLGDIELELKNYKPFFKNKIVLCNCDDPYESNFFKYFAMNFNYLGLKKLIATCYDGSPIVGTQLSLFDFFSEEQNDEQKTAYKVEINEVIDVNGDGAIDLFDIKKIINLGNNKIIKLNGNGDFRSNECIKFLEEADIVVTNPPFSLFREYVAQLVQYGKKFIIIGNINALSYKEIFPFIKDNKLWLGESIHSGDREFRVPDSYPLAAANFRIDNYGYKYIRVKGVRWFTNIDNKNRHEELVLFKNYCQEKYPKYENYDAINVDFTTDIPCDYFGNIGVPITFIDKYNPDQFEIIALGIVGSITFLSERKMEILKNGLPTGKFTINAKGTLYKKYNPAFDKKPPAFKDAENGTLYSSIYARIIIRRKQ
jgi:hypothetical protein